MWTCYYRENNQTKTEILGVCESNNLTWLTTREAPTGNKRCLFSFNLLEEKDNYNYNPSDKIRILLTF